jgi:16S rRNA processing protein RimM
MDWVVVRLRDGCYQFDIESSRAHVGYARVSLKGVETIEDAELLRNGELVVSSKELPALDDGEFYIDMLVGCRVEAEDGEDLGILQEVIEQGHHDLWSVVGPKGEILVPARTEFVAGVDMSKRLVIVKRVPGLWDDDEG